MVLEGNQQKYVKISEEKIADADSEDDSDEEDEELRQFVLEQSDEIDIFEQGGKVDAKKKQKQVNSNRYFSPCKIPEHNLLQSLETLNTQQRNFVMHVLKSVRTRPNEPFYYFLSGAAGVGKSTVINAIYQIITRHFDTIRGSNPDTLKVLLTAPSGKAAHLINGTTLHTAFSLPVNQYDKALAPLSNDVANCIRTQLKDVAQLINDEISMTGTKNFHHVHQRLVQIFGRNEPFGGISVIVVGDLNQLAPVGDKRVFVPLEKPNNTEIGKLIGPISPLWEHFEYFELTEIMRQKDEIEFINALNNLAVGNMSKEDIALIKSRETQADLVPQEAIRLFRANVDVDNYNEMRIQETSGAIYQSIAIDAIDHKLSESLKRKTLAALKNKKRSETFGLPHELNLKVGVRYMITTNEDVEDGLVNGASGVLKFIDVDKNDPQQVKVLYLDFNSNRVGVKARREHKHSLGNAIEKHWVPIKRVTREISMAKDSKVSVNRIQFPLTAAEALTIHKSQGSTWDTVCVNVSKSLSRELLYVALSRVTKLSNLYIIGNFKPPAAPKEDDPTIAEINRLKSERQLKLCFNTLTSKSGIAIGYHNVVSFPRYRAHIANDSWYKNCDILIFSETQTTSRQQPSLPDFNLVFRSDDWEVPQKRGILVFSKLDTPLREVFHRIVESKPNEKIRYHSDIVVFQMQDVYVITGYKSPKTPNNMFKSQLTEALASMDSSCKKVAIGDFNFNLHQKSNVLSSVMSEFRMMSKLPPTAFTTTDNSQIDVVFANFDSLTAGTYESYFSDHKPVYFMLNEHGITTDFLADLESEWSQHATRIKSTPPQIPSPIVNVTNLNQWREWEENYENDENIAVDDVELCLDEIIAIPDDDNQGEDVIVPRNDDLIAIIADITTPSARLKDTAIDLFIDHLINRNPSIPFKMVPTIYAQRLSRYTPVSGQHDDIQIIFNGNYKNPCLDDHYIVAHFVAAENVVKIYDSLNGIGTHGRILEVSESSILSRLYPGKSVEFVKPATLQPDGCSCGVFAIAYATTIILGYNPSDYEFEMQRSGDRAMLLRKHIKRMYEQKQLELFPKFTSIPHIAKKRVIESSKSMPKKKFKPREELSHQRPRPRSPDSIDSVSPDRDNNFILLSKEIRGPNELSAESIDKFSKLVSDKTAYHMIDVGSASYLELYEPPEEFILDDIQILFEGALTEGAVGHYICLHYTITDKVLRVYDSLYYAQLSSRANEIIDLRYPERSTIEFVRPRTMQRDGLSCAVFSIAYATAIILGFNPAYVEFDVDFRDSSNQTRELRKHLIRMIRRQELTMFPTIN